MRRNITATTKCTQDFCKSDALAQTYQIKYDCFFFAWHRKHKKIIFSRTKSKNKSPGKFVWILYRNRKILKKKL